MPTNAIKSLMIFLPPAEAPPAVTREGSGGYPSVEGFIYRIINTRDQELIITIPRNTKQQ